MAVAVKISDMISVPVLGRAINRSEGRMVELTSPPASARTKPTAAFEDHVLTYLIKHRQTLGIARVFKGEKLRVDGGLALDDGRFLAVEIKYRMGSLQACRAGWQVGAFTRRREARQYCPVGGIVFFEEFSGDWARTIKRLGGVERGWAYWYDDHAVLPGHKTFRLDLIRFREGKLSKITWNPTAEETPPTAS